MTLTVSRCRASLVLAIFMMAHWAALLGHVHTHAPGDDAAHDAACAHHHEHEAGKTPAGQLPATDDGCAVCQFLANTAVPPATAAVLGASQPAAEQVTAEPFFIPRLLARDYHSRAPPRLA